MKKPMSPLGIANLMADAADKKQKTKKPASKKAPPMVGEEEEGELSGKQKAAIKFKGKAANK